MNSSSLSKAFYISLGGILLLLVILILALFSQVQQPLVNAGLLVAIALVGPA